MHFSVTLSISLLIFILVRMITTIIIIVFKLGSKIFRVSTGFVTNGLSVSAAVLYHLSYEGPCIH